MVHCFVRGCKSNSSKRGKKFIEENLFEKVKFYRVPTEESLRRKWFERCGKDINSQTKFTLVCSKHFGPEDFARDLQQELLNLEPKYGRKLKPDAVPNKNLPAKDSAADLRRRIRQRSHVQDLYFSMCAQSRIYLVQEEHRLQPITEAFNWLTVVPTAPVAGSVFKKKDSMTQTDVDQTDKLFQSMQRIKKLLRQNIRLSKEVRERDEHLAKARKRIGKILEANKRLRQKM